MGKTLRNTSKQTLQADKERHETITFQTRTVWEEIRKMPHRMCLTCTIRCRRTRTALVAAHRSTDNIVDGICHAIVKAEHSNLKVGINDKGLTLSDERNSTAISAFM